MPSLDQLLDRHGSVLILDAASARAQAGLCAAGSPPRWQAREGEAGIALFACVRELGAKIAGIGAFAFCEGPGSILGIRTTAMAIRTWCARQRRPVYAYGSLELVAQAIGDRDLSVIADARREAWHEFTLAGGLRRVGASEVRLPAATPAGFRHWMPLPPGTAETSYDLAGLLARVPGADLFRASDAPDAFLHEEPQYAAWRPGVHQAPSR